MQNLLDIISYLLERNEYLTDLLLKQGRVIPEELQERVEIPQHMQSLGKVPWSLRKAALEKNYRKPKANDLGMPAVSLENIEVPRPESEIISEVANQLQQDMEIINGQTTSAE